MISRWPTELGDDGSAPASIMLVASGDEHLMRQAMYQVQAARQLHDRGYEPSGFQVPLVGKIARITIPIAMKSPSGGPVVVYTQSEEWTRERISDLRTWVANLREESDAPVIVASRVPPPDASTVPEVAELLHLPYDTLNRTSAPATGEAPAVLLPCLKERKWVGREQTVCRALWENEASAYMPWLAIGYDHPHTFEFISNQKLAEMNTSERALEAQALANLSQRPASWKPFDVDMQSGKRLHMLLCTDDFFAAERIVDAGFMRQAQRLLKAPGLLVGIPRRGLLMATTVADSGIVKAFGVAAAAEFSRAETAPISPMLFALKDGAIVGIVETLADALVPHGEPKGAEQAEDDPNAPRLSVLITRNDRGTEDVHLMAGGEDGLRLAKGIESAFMQLMKEHAARKEFSGHIQIVVLGTILPSARTHIGSVLAHLRGVCSEISTGERQYRVTLTYERSSPDSHSAEPADGSGPVTAATGRTAAANGGRSSRTWVRLVLVVLLALIALSRLLAN